VALDGQRLTGLTPPQFEMQIKLRFKPGDELPLTILRDGREQVVRIKLAR
jgi:hypothetical protein